MFGEMKSIAGFGGAGFVGVGAYRQPRAAAVIKARRRVNIGAAMHLAHPAHSDNADAQRFHFFVSRKKKNRR
jgi:hypothetical protein